MTYRQKISSLKRTFTSIKENDVIYMNSTISLTKNEDSRVFQKMNLPRISELQNQIDSITNENAFENPEDLMKADAYFLDTEIKSTNISEAITYWKKLIDDFEKNNEANEKYLPKARVLPLNVRGRSHLVVSIDRNEPDMGQILNGVANTYTLKAKIENLLYALSPALKARGATHERLSSLDYDLMIINALEEENEKIYAAVRDSRKTVTSRLQDILQNLKGEKYALESEFNEFVESKNEIKDTIDSMKNNIYGELILQQKTAFDETLAENAKTIERYPGSIEKMALLIEKNIPAEDIESVFSARDVRPYFRKGKEEQSKEVKEIFNQMHKIGKKKDVSIETVRKIYDLAEKYIDLQNAERKAKKHFDTYMNDPMNKADSSFASKYRAIERLDKIMGKSANKLDYIESKIKPIERYFKRNSGAF